MPVIFHGYSATGGREVYISNGQPGGTRLLKDIDPGAGSGISDFFGAFGILGQHAFFGASDPVNGGQVWITDGTTAGTLALGPLLGDFARLGETLVCFGVDNGTYTINRLGEDGLVSSARAPASLTTPGTLSDGVEVNGQIVFQALGATGWELWGTDGTRAGTHLIRDISPGTAGPIQQSSFPAEFTRLGDVAIFSAYTLDGQEVWATDGTRAGTFQLKDINPAGSSEPNGFLTVGTRCFFAAGNATTGAELWVTDGTKAGTRLVEDLYSGATGALRNGLDGIALGDRLLFVGSDAAHGDELWISNGTAGGTRLLKDLSPGADGSEIAEFALLNGVAYFQVSTPLGVQLWRSDGTAGGTRLVKDIQEGGGWDPRPMAVADGKLYFSVKGFTTGVEVWVSDGTAAGTQALADINPGPGDGYPGGFAALPDLPGTAPTDITLSRSRVAELAASGALVGNLGAVDAEGDDGFTWYLLDDAGGRFQLDGRRLEVADGLLLDFEQQASWTVRVQVTDGFLHTYVETLTLTLTDITPETATGDARANRFTGGTGRDSFSGLDGDDTLDGGEGRDTLTGGNGSDTYIVTDGDVVAETGTGIDEVRSSGTWTLGTNLETLTLTGNAAINGTGNDQDNTLFGNRAANVLSGLGGTDAFDGYQGNDTLTGGAGTDFFAFQTAPDTATNRDTITDFAPGTDRLFLLLSTYSAAGAATGTLAAAAFWASASGTAHDGDDRILYNTTTGVLTYDTNGDAAGGATQFAVLLGAPDLSAADITLF